MVAAKLDNISHGGDRKSDQDANLYLDISKEKAAKLLNVSEGSIVSTKAVQRDGTEELQQAVTKG